ncbi:MAG: nucleoside triphosphate pyrophosphohydrolase [Desulfobacterales bacterium]|nr:nucleoside triphosphate pyrophosphohydrolase [Desulfobacterales bacterium]
MEKTPKTRTPCSIEALIQLIETLRGKNGCPWDKKQTSRSMALYLVEELYELLDAIEKDDPDNVCEELGDVLFHIFFIARLFEEAGKFNIEDVVARNIEKMTRRHPHVFGSTPLESAEEVKQQWHTIKTSEKKSAPDGSLLDSLPSRLPALMRAYRISERVAKAGFDWNDMHGVLSKVEEEWRELKSAIQADGGTGLNQGNVLLELGDLLFTLVNVARFAHIHPETALADATKKFEARFREMEIHLAAAGKTLASLTPKEMDLFWETAKSAADR